VSGLTCSSGTMKGEYERLLQVEMCLFFPMRMSARFHSFNVVLHVCVDGVGCIGLSDDDFETRAQLLQGMWVVTAGIQPLCRHGGGDTTVQQQDNGQQAGRHQHRRPQQEHAPRRLLDAPATGSRQHGGTVELRKLEGRTATTSHQETASFVSSCTCVVRACAPARRRRLRLSSEILRRRVELSARASWATNARRHTRC